MSFFSPTILAARGTQLQPTPPASSPPVHVPDDYRIPLSQLPLGVVLDTAGDPNSPIAQPSAPRNRALRDWVSVLDYGTYIAGDMTATLLAATNDARSRGKLCYVPPNTYLLSSAITDPNVLSNLALIGDDPFSTILKQAPLFATNIVNLNSNGFYSAPQAVTATSNPGDLAVTIVSTAGINEGDIVLLRAFDQGIVGDPGPSTPNACALYGEFAMVHSVVGNTLNFYGRLGLGYNINNPVTRADCRKLNSIAATVEGIGFLNGAPGTQSVGNGFINIAFFRNVDILHCAFFQADNSQIVLQQGCDWRVLHCHYEHGNDAPGAGGNNPYGIIVSKASQHGLVEHLNSRYGRHVFTTGGNTGSVNTTIAVGSNGQTLPQPTINVASTASFTASGVLFIAGNSTGDMAVVAYTGGGGGGTQFTGCTVLAGGLSTLATGQEVRQPTEVGQSYLKVANSIATDHTQSGFDTHPGAHHITFENLTVHNQFSSAPAIQVRTPDCDVVNPTLLGGDPNIYFYDGADRCRLLGGRSDLGQIGVYIANSDDILISGEHLISGAINDAIHLQGDAAWTPRLHTLTIGDLIVTGSPANIINDVSGGKYNILYAGRFRTPVAVAVAPGGSVDAYWNSQRTSNVSTFPSSICASQTLTSGTVYGIPADVRETGTYSQIRFSTRATVSGLTDLRVGIYSPPGTAAPLLQGSANLSGTVTTANTVYTLALGAAVQLYAGQTVLLAIGFIGTGLTVQGVGEVSQTASLKRNPPRSGSGWTTGNPLLANLTASVPGTQTWLELVH